MKNLTLFLIVFLFFSCSSGNEKILKEANDIHNESLAIEKEILPKFAELELAKNSINVQGRALTEEEIKFTRDFDLLSLSLNYWQENHMVVSPTFPKDNKNSTVEFSPQDILLIQKEYNDSIVAIRTRVENLKVPSSGL